ncbi:cytochrome b/b6 domain-containing protein [Thioclava sp. DLFJ4-1]|uniref:cytochrome b/b6 domain-containing protein n=1 Tax=Thioclava sp. DLFJ4-1 TaxID=1915313 RepID=UPI0009972DC8|nr:cytochrome b/b6 domain-containing protein [Thioclava sp. DLFJ4-1]OOY18063.1 cytochrome B [Thioclava sp. DLFJ4-1]
MKDTAASPAKKTVTVWDPVVRLFHWLLVAAFAAAWGLGEWGPNQMTWHFYAGYAIAGLLAVRLIWGFVGSRTARFSHFLYGPKAVAEYLRHLPSKESSGHVGHNPLGGWSVLVMLALLIVQVVTGLTSDPQDYINVGPLAGSVPESISTSWAPKIHEFVATLLLIVVGIHIAAIVYYRTWKGVNLVKPMITGKKEVGE